MGPLLSDLRELSPSLADGLEALLAYEPNPAEGRGSVEDVFCRAFVAPAGADGRSASSSSRGETASP